MFQNRLSNLANFQGIQMETDITVITPDDGLTHTYCSKIKWEKDNRLPIGIAKLIMPYDENISKYWIKYSGTVIIHANLNSQKKREELKIEDSTSLNLKNMQKDKEPVEITKNTKSRLQNNYYNYSFIGKVNRFKQYGTTFIVYLEDVGWKFTQKVPKEFRSAFIANQKLGDAFQAICEFMGVDFAYSIEDLNQFTFGGDGYSIQKDGKTIEDVATILSEWGKPKEDEENKIDEDNTEDPRTAEEYQSTSSPTAQLEKEYAKQQINQALGQSNNQSTNQTNNQATEEKTEEEIDEQTMQLQQEFDEKIRDLFIGNTIYDSNISDPILNYDWITITPQASSDTSSTTGTTTGDTSSGTGDSSNSSNSNGSGNAATGVGYTYKETPQPSGRAIRDHRKSDAARIYEQNTAPFRAIWGWLTGG